MEVAENRGFTLGAGRRIGAAIRIAAEGPLRYLEAVQIPPLSPTDTGVP